MSYTPPLRENVQRKVYRYRKEDRGFWFGLPFSLITFGYSLYELSEALRSSRDTAAVFWGLVSIGSAMLGWWAAFSAHGRRIEVGSEGIASVSRGGRIAAAWEEVKNVRILSARWSKKPKVYVQTSRGDFSIEPELDGMAEVLAALREHLPDRVVEAKGIRPWRLTCSNCGTAFWSRSCPFCEVPCGEEESRAAR